MNKAYKYTLTANEHKEITFDVGVNRFAISNANGADGNTTILMEEITRTDSGDICSFVDGADAPFADFKVNIEAVQSGSGDPSLSNVRPISGWTGATINVSGEDTSDPTTYNINWQSTAGTVYGGSLDVKTGVLTDNFEHIHKSLSQANSHTDYGDYTVYYFLLNHQSTGANVDTDKKLCSIAKYQYVGDNGSTHFYITGSTKILALFVPSGLSTDTEFDAIYPIIEGETSYQLTPVEIRSLLGINNVWADCGPVDVRYFVQSTQPLFDYINDEDDRCVYIDCEQTGADTYSITSDITKAEFISLLNKNKNVKLRLRLDPTNSVIYDLSYIYATYADFTYNRSALISGISSFQSMTLRVDMSGDTLSLSRHTSITIGDGTYEYVTGQNNQLIKDGWSWSTQGYSLTDADELLFMVTPGVNVASDSDTIIGELQRSSQGPKRALFCKGIKNMLPDVQEIESPFWFNDIVVVGNKATYTNKNDIIMKIRVWTRYYSEPQHTLADVNFYADCDCSDSTANLWGMCNIFVFKKTRS